jgi:hypothetical protein
VNIKSCGADLDRLLVRIRPLSGEGTLVSVLAADTIRMARAYLSDGNRFERRGDLVNALASYAYAFGWTDCGGWIGLFSCVQERGRARDWGIAPAVPSGLDDHLAEKTGRYDRLLSDAVRAADTAAETGTVPEDFGLRVLLAASVCSRSGEYLASAGHQEEALFLFSYGHAWLDAGVRAGLLRVSGDRELFTV